MTIPAAPSALPAADFQLLWFTQLLARRVCQTREEFRVGKLTDLVVRLGEPYPEAVGIFISHGWGEATEFIPWERVVRVEHGTVFVLPPEAGDRYPAFVDQPGWLLLNEHLMGRTILDLDGRGVEVVNDVQLLASKGRMLLVHVDVSFNGFLRKWHVAWASLQKDQLISWKHVQPLSVEDAVAGDEVKLAVTRDQTRELPVEDLADALEELSGEAQQAMFSALDSETAAETLLETEPRAQRQIVEDLAPERARAILAEMTAAQVADLLSALPWDDRMDLLALMPREQAERTRAILASDDVTAGSLMSAEFVAMGAEVTVDEALVTLRRLAPAKEEVSYVYVTRAADGVLLGAVDARELLVSAEALTLRALMASPAVSAEAHLTRSEVVDLFAKYQFRMLPVVAPDDRLLGVIRYKDIMR